MPKPWIVYTRVSTDEQAAEGVSLAAQREACIAMLRAGGISDPVHVEDAGYSAKSLDRPGIARVLAALDSREIAGVCVYRLDRLTRSVRDLLDLVDRFDKAGAAMRSVSEMLDTQSPMGRFTVTLLGAMAQWERETIAVRVKMGMRHRLAAGGYVGSAVPAGCRVVGEPGNKRLEAIPEIKPIATEAWAMVARGSTLADVVRFLTAERFPIPKANGRKAVAWNTNNLHYWLGNPKMIGMLVDRQTFDAARKALAGRWSPRRLAGRATAKKAASERVWPFRGLLRCGLCGQALVGTAAIGRGGKVYHYLRCAARIKAACKLPDLPADAYERALVEGIVAKVRSPDVIERIAQATADVQAEAKRAAGDVERLTMARDAAQQRVDRLLDLVASGGMAGEAARVRIEAETVAVAQADERLAAVRGAMAAAEVSRASVDILAEQIREGAERLLTAPPAMLGAALAAIVRDVVLTEDRADIAVWLPGGSYEFRLGGACRTVVRTAVTLRATFEHHREGTGRKRVVRVVEHAPDVHHN